MPFAKTASGNAVHVCTPGFGRYVNVYEFYEELIKNVKKLRIPKNIDGFTLNYLIREIYTDMFGIVDLDDTNHPLGIVRYTNADTLGDIGPIAEVINDYRTYDILDKFGLTLVDYFDMPISITKILINRSKAEKEDQIESMEKTENAADKELNKLSNRLKNKNM